MRRLTVVELSEHEIADESTIRRLQHLVEEHDLTQAVFDDNGMAAGSARAVLKHATILDATIISAPSWTKNQTRSRDSEMRQTNNWQRLVFRD